jgi:hypothetical protein
MSVTVLAAAGIALAAGGLLQPAVSHAAFNKQSYDKCAEAADKRFVQGVTNAATHTDEYKFCCIRSGGVWEGGNRGCVEQAATGPPAQPQTPGSVVSPLPGKAALP